MKIQRVCFWTDDCLLRQLHTLLLMHTQKGTDGKQVMPPFQLQFPVDYHISYTIKTQIMNPKEGSEKND